MRLATSRDAASDAAAVEGTTAMDAAAASTAAGRRSGRCVDNTGCPSLSAPTGLAGGLARKRCARPWTDKALRPYYLGPPLLASDEDSAMSGRRVPNLSVGELPPPRPHLPRCSIRARRSLPDRQMYEKRDRARAGRTARREAITPQGRS